MGGLALNCHHQLLLHDPFTQSGQGEKISHLYVFSLSTLSGVVGLVFTGQRQWGW